MCASHLSCCYVAVFEQRKHESASALVDQLYEAFSEATERQFVKDKQYEMLAAREQALQEQVSGLARAMAAFAAAAEAREGDAGPREASAPAAQTPPASNVAPTGLGAGPGSVELVKDLAAEAASAAAAAAAAAATSQLQAQLVRGYCAHRSFLHVRIARRQQYHSRSIRLGWCVVL